MNKLSKSSLSSLTLFKVINFIAAVSLVVLEIFLNLIAVGAAINGLVFLTIATSPLWILLLIFWWPMIIILTLLLKFTSVRTYLI